MLVSGTRWIIKGLPLLLGIIIWGQWIYNNLHKRSTTRLVWNEPWRTWRRQRKAEWETTEVWWKKKQRVKRRAHTHEEEKSRDACFTRWLESYTFVKPRTAFSILVLLSERIFPDLCWASLNRLLTSPFLPTCTSCCDGACVSAWQPSSANPHNCTELSNNISWYLSPFVFSLPLPPRHSITLSWTLMHRRYTAKYYSAFKCALITRLSGHVYP